MRPFILFIAISMVSVTGFSQYSVGVDIILENSPGAPVDVTVELDCEPPVTMNVTTNSMGFYSGYATIPSSGWTSATASFYDCQNSLVEFTYPNDSFNPYYSVYFYMDYCSDGSIYGCTDPDAVNYNPASVFEDGSCIFIDQAPNDLCEDAFLLHEGVIWMSNVNAFYEINPTLSCDGQTGSFQDASVWFSFTMPDYLASVSINTYADGSNSLTNTQLSVLDRSCGGAILFCDEDSGEGLFSNLEIGCGQLLPGVTYLLKINGVDAQMGTCFLSLDFDSTCADIWGCTNPASYNYDPTATIDDGSCIDPDGCNPLFLQISGPADAQGDFQIMRDDSVFIDSTFAGGNQLYDLCVPAGCLQFVINVPPVGGIETIVTTVLNINGFMNESAVGTYDFSVIGCVPWNQYGCMDSLAINYDPFSTSPNNICYYLPECGSQMVIEAVQISCNKFLIEGSPYLPNIDWTSTDATILETGNNYAIIQSDSSGEIAICGSAGEDQCNNLIENCLSLTISESCFEACPSGIISSFENAGCNMNLELNVTNAEELEAFWNFGDGQTESAIGDVEHEFESSGYYFVCASFIDPNCEQNVVCDLVLVVDCGEQSILGCTIPDAINFNPDATINDGSCDYSFDCSFGLDALLESSEGDVLIIQPTIDLETAQNVLWNFGDGTTSTELFPQHIYPNDGPYNLCLTATFIDGLEICHHTSCIEVSAATIDGAGFVASGFSISVINGSSPVGISEIMKPQKLEVWPNPVLSVLNLEYQLSQENSVKIKVIDFSGRTIFEITDQGITGENRIAIDLTGYTAGLYLLDFESDNQKIVQKIIVAN